MRLNQWRRWESETGQCNKRTRTRLTIKGKEEKFIISRCALAYAHEFCCHAMISAFVNNCQKTGGLVCDKQAFLVFHFIN